jgi:hypothetical protein
MVSVLMKQRGLGLQEAIDLVGDYCRACIDRFEQDRQQLPSWGPEVDNMIAHYADGLQNWIVGKSDRFNLRNGVYLPYLLGSLHWSFHTERYFGKHGLEVKKHRTIQLLPKKTQCN